MALDELDAVQCGRPAVDLQTPEVYPIGPRPEVRISLLLEEGRSDRAAGSRRAG